MFWLQDICKTPDYDKVSLLTSKCLPAKTSCSYNPQKRHATVTNINNRFKALLMLL